MGRRRNAAYFAIRAGIETFSGKAVHTNRGQNWRKSAAFPATLQTQSATISDTVSVVTPTRIELVLSP